MTLEDSYTGIDAVRESIRIPNSVPFRVPIFAVSSEGASLADTAFA